MNRIFLYIALTLLTGLRVAAQTSTPAAVKSGIQKDIALHADHIVTVAAANSSERDKTLADFVCTGSNDEQTIQKAINSLGVSGRVELYYGTYMIDGFTDSEDGQTCCAIGVPVYDGMKASIEIVGQKCGRRPVLDTTEKVTGVTLAVSKRCYEALDAKKEYAVVACKGNRTGHAAVKNLSVNLPDNQKNIVCIDGSRFEGIWVENCELQATDKNQYDRKQKPHVGVEGCVGVRGVQGSNYSFEFYMAHIVCVGFGVGFAVGGEHFYGEYLSSVFCTRGFTFNGYRLASGVWTHPITLINCCDEAPCYYPLFGENPYRQPIDIINFNMEHYPNYFAAGGLYATETTPGQWYGFIDYSIMNFDEGTEMWLKNDPAKRFWAAGSGVNLKSKNNAQKQMCTTAERLGYAPNYMQQVWDTDKNKLCVCIDPEKPLWVDAMGKKVDGRK